MVFERLKINFPEKQTNGFRRRIAGKYKKTENPNREEERKEDVKRQEERNASREEAHKETQS